MANQNKTDGASSAAITPPRGQSEQMFELLEGLRDVARAEIARNPVGYAAQPWRRVQLVLEEMVPDAPADDAPEATRRTR